MTSIRLIAVLVMVCFASCASTPAENRVIGWTGILVGVPFTIGGVAAVSADMYVPPHAVEVVSVASIVAGVMFIAVGIMHLVQAHKADPSGQRSSDEWYEEGGEWYDDWY